MARASKSKSNSDSTAASTARLSSTPARVLLLAAAAFGLSSVACGPLTPVSPTWKDDVRPLLVSRCMRCHDGSTKGDPKVTGSTAGSVAYNFDYPDLPSPLPAGLMFLRMSGPAAVKGDKAFLRRMPPPPLEALDAWQIEIIEGWAADPR